MAQALTRGSSTHGSPDGHTQSMQSARSQAPGLGLHRGAYTYTFHGRAGYWASVTPGGKPLAHGRGANHAIKLTERQPDHHGLANKRRGSAINSVANVRRTAPRKRRSEQA